MSEMSFRPAPGADVVRPGDAPTSCCCELETTSGPAGPILVLHVAGEIDMVSLPVLHRALDAALEQRPCDLVVDLAGVAFCCVRGFALLAATATAAQVDGTSYAVSGLTPLYSRVASMLWPEDTCVRHQSVAAAVTAIRTERTRRPA